MIHHYTLMEVRENLSEKKTFEKDIQLNVDEICFIYPALKADLSIN